MLDLQGSARSSLDFYRLGKVVGEGSFAKVTVLSTLFFPLDQRMIYASESSLRAPPPSTDAALRTFRSHVAQRRASVGVVKTQS